MSARVFTCSLDNAKRCFYRAFNSLFGKIGRIASEDVIVQLVKTKCLPVLYYCLEVCPLKTSQLSAVDFALNCTFRKIFFPAVGAERRSLLANKRGEGCKEDQENCDKL